ncbi:phosphotransferase [Paenarthrobacter sp. DKR-5]|uniref:phosphotransferase n=1 Tax=Paenarthrobacter sp. DKR-5 TaxID=2835535 RepID=UPI001BDD6305|nr:phosphotransferase [Paenarthrobacter sp. DKR-5]
MRLVAEWAAARLGAGRLEAVAPAAGGEMSSLFRYDRQVGAAAVKVRGDSVRRVDHCLQAQRVAAAAGFPCARPLTGAERLDGGLVVSAEEWRPGGEILRGDHAEPARRSGQLLGDLLAVLEAQAVEGFDPPPPWMHWNPSGGSLWAPNPSIDGMDQARVPETTHILARRVSARLAQCSLPKVLGHGDWEAQNIRWQDGRALAVHDWDSLVALPEAAIVGAASGAFASAETPTLAPIPGSAAFIRSYEQARGRTFTDEESEVACAASLWPALHNARGEYLVQSRPVAASAVMDQAEERLRLAGA